MAELIQDDKRAAQGKIALPFQTPAT